MKPLYTKKNGTSQRVAAIEVKMPASYPASKLSYESVSVTADGVKTYDTLFTELYAAADESKITRFCAIERVYANGSKEPYAVMYLDGTAHEYEFSLLQASNSGMYMRRIRIGSSRLFARYNATSLAENYTSVVAPTGEKWSLYY